MSGIFLHGSEMTNGELWNRYLELLIAANDETKTVVEHDRAIRFLNGWLAGVYDATGKRFNGDYYYIEKGIDRLMCCGLFLDWECKHE